MPIIRSRITYPIGRVIEAIVHQDGSCELLIEVPKKIPAIADSDLVLIDAENLSMEDEFMQHKPKDIDEEVAKKLIAEAIEKGVKNFYKPKGDVSFTDDKRGVCYFPGQMPAVSRSYDWHEKAAKDFYPERNSRLGSKLEYGAFLGVLIKKLIAEGKTARWAWNAVCSDSRELGHYRDSADHERGFEPTGSREICGLCDLANAHKILAWDDDERCYYTASGYYFRDGYVAPISEIYPFHGRDSLHNYSVGWIVLS